MKMILTFQTLFVFAFFSLSQRPFVYDIKSDSYLERDNSDLANLSLPYDSVTLIGMGESTHGTHEFTTMRHRFLKFLVENHNFNTLFLELDYSSVLNANSYINGEFINIDEAIRDFESWPFQNEEMKITLQWMRSYNENHVNNRLSIIGCDAQGVTRSKEKLIEFFSSRNLFLPEDSLKTNMSSKWTALETQKTDNLIYDVIYLKNYLFSKTDLNFSDSLDWEFRCQTLVQGVLKKFGAIDQKYIYRNKHMSDNIISYLNSYPSSKGMFWGHNGHLSFYNRDFSNKPTILPSGYYLKAELKEKYFCIAQDFRHGAYIASAYSDSLELYDVGIFNLNNKNRLSLAWKFRCDYENFGYIRVDDLRKPEKYKIRAIGSIFHKNNRKYYRYVRYHDAVILIAKGTPVNLLFWVNDPRKK